MNMIAPMTDIDDEHHCVGVWLAYLEGQLAYKLKANIDKYMGLHDVRSLGFKSALGKTGESNGGGRHQPGGAGLY